MRNAWANMIAKNNILYIHNNVDISGGEQSLLNLWENLDKDRFDLFLLVPGNGDLVRAARKLGVRIFIYAFPSFSAVSISGFFQAFTFLWKFVKQNNIRLIHSYGPRNNILSSLVGRILKVPVIWHERNIPMGDEQDVTKRLLFLPDRVICNSNAVAKRFILNGGLPPKVKVVLNGVNLKRFHEAGSFTDAKALKVGIVSNLSPRRGVERFIEAAAIIRERRPEVSFYIVGGEFESDSCGRMAQLRYKADRAGLKDHLTFTGYQEDVRPFLSSFDVCCHVTQKDACSRSVMEAMAMGKPIVAMNDGGNPELIDDGISGVLVPPGDMHTFVLAVISLLDNVGRREMLGRKARETAERDFDIVRNTAMTAQMYSGLITGAVV